ncbi:hypothetical protein JCGZ_09003 [Jatropha curcas]|uniref:Membrane-associated kinase regulator 4 n=2 Tax=Jatropha curcas TaxID=180498 RepID=A0A067KTF9_JATCU|nr:hypothetical protein JCGZ_09003 [Jatropha curcas]
MSSINNDKEVISSPADELFYKGKLLPLYLPPRLQTVQKLLHPSTTAAAATANNNKCDSFHQENGYSFKENYSITPFITIPTSTNTTATPLESFNISPSESSRFSGELNPDEYFFELSTERNSFNKSPIKKSWSRKLKKSLLGQKLKASSAYLKSLLFTRSGCADESSCIKASRNSDIFETTDCLSKHIKVAKKNYSFGETLMKRIEKEMSADIFHSQRRSFSGVIQRHSTNKSLSSNSSVSSSSSSSFSFSSSSGFCDLQLLKRTGSVNSVTESSIEGAIAYCKKSQEAVVLLKKD